MKDLSQWAPRPRVFRLLWSTAVALPLFQAIGCSLLDPQNLIRIGFNSVLAPINNLVFDTFATLGAGP